MTQINPGLVLPVLAAFAISAVLGPIIIPMLKKWHFGATEREEGPQSHLKKSGTPAMGGLIFLSAVLVVSLVYMRDYPKILPVLLTTFGFGLVGFMDDFIKFARHRSEGLTPKQKMLGQFVVTLAFIAYYYISRNGDMSMLIPFGGGSYLVLGWVGIPVAFLAILGTVNAVNFTDGIDGLSASVTSVVAAFFTVASLVLDGGIHPITCALMGGLMGYLLYNVYPAKVFMGDTGSLAMGGFVVSAAYMLELPIFILIVGLVYWAELISVMLQVTYFKATHGKRLFRMTPIHHHFELGGWSETRIVAVFTITTIMLALIGFAALPLQA